MSQKESEWENTKKAFLKELKQALQNNIPHAVDTEFSKFLPAVETAIDTIVSTREKEIAEEVGREYPGHKDTKSYGHCNVQCHKITENMVKEKVLQIIKKH